MMAEDENHIDGSDTEPSGGMTEAEIDRNLMETFPASDPPSWTLGIEHHEETQSEETQSGKNNRTE